MNANRTARSLIWQLAVIVLLVIAAGVGYVLGQKTHTVKQGQTTPRQLWTCSMHPQIVRDAPGRCPICHMELTPLRGTAPTTPGSQPASQAGLQIDPAMAQNMGIRTGTVIEGPVTRTVRAVGSLEEAQPNIHDINLRISGWIRRVYVPSEGTHVEAGNPLFDIFSPELNLAIEELIAAHKPDGDQSLFEAAARRLELLGLDKSQIDALSRLDKAPEAVTFRSPISGHVTDKPIVDGMAAKAGDRALRLVDHTTLWIDARVFERDLAYVKLGTKATATVASRPRNAYTGEIIFIHPHVDMTTRSGMVRMEVKNAGLALKPGMYATVQIETQPEERAVLAPREAVLDSGDSQVVVVALKDGHFEPRPVKVGLSSDDGLVQIVSGLAAGDEVVTSGQFLIDSESRMKEALQRFESKPAPGTAPPPTPPLTPQPAPAAAIKPLPSLDAVTRAYLNLADALGAEQKKPDAIDVADLVQASARLKVEAADSPVAVPAALLADSAAKMKAQPIDAQRTTFKSLSEAMIALMDASPPSTAVGEALYIMECPMFPGRWIQRKDELANPFYATDMKECGSHVKVIKTRAGDQK